MSSSPKKLIAHSSWVSDSESSSFHPTPHLSHSAQSESTWPVAILGLRSDVSLLPHQIVGVNWMREKERSVQKGGILGDEMGLGKTMQSLALSLDYLAQHEPFAPSSTLIICPAGLIEQWRNEIMKVGVNPTIVVHHGSKRSNSASSLKKAMFVITSPQLLVSEHKAYLTRKSDMRDIKKDALFRVEWLRVIIDEAHEIRNSKTKKAAACFALVAQYRWCLSGTPLHNNLEELWSFVNFLQLTSLENRGQFDRQYIKPLKDLSTRQGAMGDYQNLLDRIMLRRTKDLLVDGRPLLVLPQQTIATVSCQFDEYEKGFYLHLKQTFAKVLGGLVAEERCDHRVRSVLALIMRLRQACLHPILPFFCHNNPFHNEEDTKLEQINTGRRNCRLCQTSIDNDLTGSYCVGCESLRTQAIDATVGLSTKVRKALEILHEIKIRSGGTEKTIVFSEFTSMLDLVGVVLAGQNTKFIRYDGSMSKEERDTSLRRLETDHSISCILISIKAGGTGLNLTACNNIILLDLPWNPAVEEQAFGRVHRIGQTRPVRIYKLVVEKTIEDRILQGSRLLCCCL